MGIIINHCKDPELLTNQYEFDPFFWLQLSGKHTKKISSLRILGPSNGRVNEPLFRRGVDLGPQNNYV